MNIRSVVDLMRILDRHLAWRKKELSSLKFVVDGAQVAERNTVLRAAICLLYAHWEGFVKEAATAYVCFVASQGLKVSDVTPNLVALGLRSDIQRAGVSTSATVHTNLARKFMGGQDAWFSPNCDSAINTRSNLNSDALVEVLCIVGIDAAAYEDEAPTIDKRLLKNRNAVAHGEGIPIDPDDYESLHGTVLRLISTFRDDIETAAGERKYRRVKGASS